jgi:hypothetical protein
MIGLLVTMFVSAATIKVADAAPSALPPLTGKDAPPIISTRVGRGPYYPSKAQDLHKEGRSDIQCVISDKHAITQCVVVSETPPNWGFGAAAVNFFTGMKVPEMTKSGEPTAGREYTIYMNFKLD